MSNCRPSVNSSSVPAVLDSSTVMTPSLPTLSKASAMSSPISCDWAEIAATWAISALPPTSRAVRRQLGRHGLYGGVDPLLEVHRGSARRDVAQALADHGLGQDGGRGGAVAGHVVGLGRDLLGQLGAKVLVGVVELDLTSDGHPVVGDRRRAELLVDDDVAALGAEGHLDGVSERVDAALEAAPGFLVELEGLGHGGFRWSSRTQTAPGARVGRRGGCCGMGSS